jgi:hypothetical protein
VTNYEPPQVRAGRARIAAGDRLPDEVRPMRPYFCRGCGAQELSVLVPRGWYTLTRASGSESIRPVRLGLYCSARCLEEQMDRLIGIQDDLGDEFDRAPSPYQQQATR